MTDACRGKLDYPLIRAKLNLQISSRGSLSSESKGQLPRRNSIPRKSRRAAADPRALRQWSRRSGTRGSRMTWLRVRPNASTARCGSKTVANAVADAAGLRPSLRQAVAVQSRRGGRAVEGGGLETRSTVSPRNRRRQNAIRPRNHPFRGFSLGTPGDRRGHLASGRCTPFVSLGVGLDQHPTIESAEESIAKIGKRLRKECEGTGGYPRVREGTPIGTTCPNPELPLAV